MICRLLAYWVTFKIDLFGVLKAVWPWLTAVGLVALIVLLYALSRWRKTQK